MQEANFKDPRNLHVISLATNFKTPVKLLNGDPSWRISSLANDPELEIWTNGSMAKEGIKMSNKIVSCVHSCMQVNTSNSRAREPNWKNLEYLHRPLQKQNQTSQNVLMQHPSKEQAISKTCGSGLAEILVWQQRRPPNGNPYQYTTYYEWDEFISHRP